MLSEDEFTGEGRGVGRRGEVRGEVRAEGKVEGKEEEFKRIMLQTESAVIMPLCMCGYRTLLQSCAGTIPRRTGSHVRKLGRTRGREGRE